VNQASLVLGRSLLLVIYRSRRKKRFKFSTSATALDYHSRLEPHNV